MYGFGGVGQVEVRFGQMSPWRDKRTNNQTRKDRATGAVSFLFLPFAQNWSWCSHEGEGGYAGARNGFGLKYGIAPCLFYFFHLRKIGGLVINSFFVVP